MYLSLISQGLKKKLILKSSCMKVGFGLGYVTPEYAKAGTEIAVVVREKPLRAEVVKIPFV